MSKRHRKHSSLVSVPKDILPLAVLLVCFLVSGIFGCLLVANSGEESTASFASFLTHYATYLSAEPVLPPSFLSVLLEFFVFPVLVFLLGFSSLGILLIPAVFCVRAFLLSYTISAFFCVFGTFGSIASFALFGLHVLIAIPVSFAIGCYAYPSSIRKAMDGGSVRSYFIGNVLPLTSCGMFILSGAVLQWAFMPSLLSVIFRQMI